jgi:hypothetical protein
MGIGDWGLGIGDWGLGPIPNPQSPIPIPKIFNIKIIFFFLLILINIKNNINKSLIFI